MKTEGEFRFKRFNVRHTNSAMKVGTDGVLLGAWADVDGVDNAIDVGCGTGLISLMLAQRGVGHVVGVEIEPVAAEEAKANVAASPWPYQIEIACSDFLTYQGERVDLIVSNPPFFTETTLSPEARRSTARNSQALPLPDLLRISAGLLKPQGRIALILPASQEKELRFQATLHRLHIKRITRVADYAGKYPKRILVELSPQASHESINQLFIRTSPGGGYTEEMIELTSGFYL